MTDATAGGKSFNIVHEGVQLSGTIFLPRAAQPAAALPAVLMFPGATGPGPSFLSAAADLAASGYLVVTTDMYGSDADISTPQSAGTYFAALRAEPERIRARAFAWFEAVRDLPETAPSRMAAIGYCFGGMCVLELARAGADLRLVSSFHGLLGTHAPARPGAVRGQVAIWTGGRDPYAPASDVAALREEFDGAGVDYQLTVFSRARHGFTDPDHDGYSPDIAYDRFAHRVVWTGTQTMLEESIGST